MDYFGIDQALAYHSFGPIHMRSTELNAILAEETADEARLIPAFLLGIHPTEHTPGAEAFLPGLWAAGGKAVWMRKAGELPGLWPWLVGEIVEALAAARVPVLLHCDDFSPDDLYRFAENFPSLSVILTGVSYGSDAWLYPLLRAHSQVRLCTGHFYVPPGSPETFLNAFGAERLIFGSGLPHFSPGGLIGQIMYARIPDTAKEAILSGNLLALLEEVKDNA
ncbi:MAG: amidohydrolase family protein [Planctomycetota bacterium]|jgi:predicted TIM-barrel fold metal-dependent hydrolase